MVWNLESKTALDSFAWGEQETKQEFLVILFPRLGASSPGCSGLFPGTVNLKYVCILTTRAEHEVFGDPDKLISQEFVRQW